MFTKKEAKVLLIVLTIIALFLWFIFFLAGKQHIAFGDLTRDVFHLGDIPIYSGILSNMGVFMWLVSFSICLFTYISLRFKRSKKKFIEFVLFFGILSLLLLLDDFFMLHERVYYHYLGIPEKVIFGGYGLLLIYGLIRFRKTILNTDYIFLLSSLFFIAFSVAVDVFQNRLEEWCGQWRIVLEDGMKFAGIAVWSFYFIKTCYEEFKLIYSPE